jgi:hypothetical protein
VSKASQIIVLCEDQLQAVVIRRFLKKGWSKDTHDVRVFHCPPGGSSGAGEKYVRDNYANQLSAYRDRSAKASTILIVAIDADAGTVQTHHHELDRVCRRAQPPVAVRQADEAVVHIIPKWHIETWLAYLDNVSTSESSQYKPQYSFKERERDCYRLVDKLIDACKLKQQLENRPDSLVQACKEFERIRGLL